MNNTLNEWLNDHNYDLENAHADVVQKEERIEELEKKVEAFEKADNEHDCDKECSHEV